MTCEPKCHAYGIGCPCNPAMPTIPLGLGDDLDVAAGRCCPTCRHDLTPHNVEVWNAGYSIGQRHAQAELAEAWEAGWHEHYLEWERQKADPSHPITATNPYRERA